MKSLLSVFFVLCALTTHANQREQVFEIDYNKQIFTQESVLHLKQEIKKLHPRINFDNWNLKQVTLVAKSARGFGEAYLKVGPRESRIETVDGSRFDFNDNGNFHQIKFPAPGQDNGVWQIHMKGRIKVKKVKLLAQQKRPARPIVERECKVLLETVWGKDVRRFSATATGPQGSGVMAKACNQAMRKCQLIQDEVPLLRCKTL